MLNDAFVFYTSYNWSSVSVDVGVWERQRVSCDVQIYVDVCEVCVCVCHRL